LGAYSELRIIALFPNKPYIKSFFDKSKVIWRHRTYCLEGDFHKALIDEEFDLIMHNSFQINIPENLPGDGDRKFIISVVRKLWEEEAFWEIHDLLEYQWKVAKYPEREKLWILIQLVVSQIKWQMEQKEISKRIVERNVKNFNELLGEGIEYSYPVKLAEAHWEIINKLIQSNI
jgi:hypothetical protein